ncbi:MAG: 30S ribosomal protein S16 [bacterium]
MLKIKLTRIGKKNQPQYRIVVAEARSKRDSKFIATIGYYNPLTTPSSFKLDRPQYDSWLEKGAQPTSTIRRLALKTPQK